MKPENFLCVHGHTPHQCAEPECGYRDAMKDRDRLALLLINKSSELVREARQHVENVEGASVEMAAALGYKGTAVTLGKWLDEKKRDYEAAK